MHQTSLAEVRFAGVPFTLQGAVTDLRPYALTLRLPALPPGVDVLTPRTPAQVAMAVKGRLYTAPAKMHSLVAENLTLELDTPPQPIQRRQRKRIACDLDTAYRFLNEDGTYGPWLVGSVTNISLSGMRLMLRPCVALPRYLELKLALHAEGGILDANGHIVGDDGIPFFALMEDRNILHLRVQVRNVWTMADPVSIGVSYYGLSSSNCLRLAHFTGDVFSD
jgi:hypothetical protein